MFAIKAGDSIPVMRLKLSDKNGPIDLTHRTPVVKVSSGPGFTPVANRAATVVNELEGDAEFAFLAEETASAVPNLNSDNPHVYLVEVTLHDDNGDELTVPALGYEAILILPRLA